MLRDKILWIALGVGIDVYTLYIGMESCVAFYSEQL